MEMQQNQKKKTHQYWNHVVKDQYVLQPRKHAVLQLQLEYNGNKEW